MQKEKESNSRITVSEWEVMRIIWTLGHTHAGEVIRQLQVKQQWTESTIKTLLRRLVNKGYLRVKRDGRRFVYYPTVSENQMMASETKNLMRHMCDMHKGQMLLDIIKDVPLSQKDIAKMQIELKEKAKTAPEKVKCNCLAKGIKDCSSL